MLHRHRQTEKRRLGLDYPHRDVPAGVCRTDGDNDIDNLRTVFPRFTTEQLGQANWAAGSLAWSAEQLLDNFCGPSTANMLAACLSIIDVTLTHVRYGGLRGQK